MLDAANNRVLAAEFRSLFAVDLNSGDRSVMSGHDLGPDGEFDSGDDQLIGGGSPFNPSSSPTDTASDVEAGVLYITDQSTGSLIAMDVDSGDRVLVSGFDF
ncbi:hypothetical protein Q668_13500 [Alcanivorax sp. PN-3]|nr:hypothetical protein Q668_13500 [Alcanivorax sp. PN-3]